MHIRQLFAKYINIYSISMASLTSRAAKATGIRSRALQAAETGDDNAFNSLASTIDSSAQEHTSQPSATVLSVRPQPHRPVRDTTNYDDDDTDGLSAAFSSQPPPVSGQKRAIGVTELNGTTESKGADSDSEQPAPPRAKRRRAGVGASDPVETEASASAPEDAAAIIPIGGTTEALRRKGPLVDRPVAITKWGLRQFVETENGVRMFLQNCVATCDLKCNPNLSYIATHARNAEYNPRRFSGLVMRIREPKCTALVFSTGKVCLAGVKNEDDGRDALRTVAKIVNKLGFHAAFADFKVQNIVATGDCGFPIRLEGIADEHSKFSSYEPELFSGLVYRMENPRVVFLIFVSGKIVITGAKTRSIIVEGVDKIFPVLFKYRKTSTLSAVGEDAAGASL